MHKKLFSKKLVCSHHNCGHKSKSIKQLLMHHDKLEEQCVKEKNSLLKLIIFYQNATISLLKYDKNKNYYKWNIYLINKNIYLYLILNLKVFKNAFILIFIYRIFNHFFRL
jgi:hypothetical protein